MNHRMQGHMLDLIARGEESESVVLGIIDRWTRTVGEMLEISGHGDQRKSLLLVLIMLQKSRRGVIEIKHKERLAAIDERHSDMLEKFPEKP